MRKRVLFFRMALCLLCAASAVLAQSDDAMKCAMVPNANVKFYLGGDVVAQAIREGEVKLKEKMASARLNDKQKNALGEMLKVLDEFGFRGIQFSLAFSEETPVPSCCLAIQCEKAVSIDSVAAIIKRNDKENRLMFKGVQNGVIPLVMGMVMVSVEDSGHLVIVATGADFWLLRQNIAMGKRPAQLPGVADVKTDGPFHVYFMRSAGLDKFMKEIEDNKAVATASKYVKVDKIVMSGYEKDGLKILEAEAICQDEEDAKRTFERIEKEMASLKDDPRVTFGRNGKKLSALIKARNYTELRELNQKAAPFFQALKKKATSPGEQ